MAEPESFIGESVATAPTPHLVVQRSTVERNAKTMRDRAEALGVSLRPHIKTHKTIEGEREERKGRGENARTKEKKLEVVF
jgi:D-serine deaminase-like pyridoxal phosphate-dependent protein